MLEHRKSNNLIDIGGGMSGGKVIFGCSIMVVKGVVLESIDGLEEEDTIVK